MRNLATILVVEDHLPTQLLTASRIKPYFEVICANDGLQALEIIYSKQVDLIVADIMMPSMDGYALLKTLRAERNDVPVILLTAKQAFEDKLEGFMLGSDDYLTKPLDYGELLLRIGAILRRSKIATQHKIVIGDVVIDSLTYTVSKQLVTIELPKKEFDLLFKLLSYPNQIFTRTQLLDEIWGYDSPSGDETIKTHISRIRKKLIHMREFDIVTIKGVGYKAEIKEG